MAYVNFSNLPVVQTFTSPHTMNAWGLLSTHPYRKVQPITDRRDDEHVHGSVRGESKRPDSNGVLRRRHGPAVHPLFELI